MARQNYCGRNDCIHNNIDRMIEHSMTADKITVSYMPVDKMTVDKMTVD
jgi:hypothetical protein